MKKISITLFAVAFYLSAFMAVHINLKLKREFTVDSLGACQGISYQNGKIFLYGDREVGIIREYKLANDSLDYQHKEYKLTVDGKDVINHPTGIAYNGKSPVFIGNSIRLNPEGTHWKAVIYCVNWPGLLKTGTLDGNILGTIDDDTCIQGTRPEYVKYKGKWFVATADYGNKKNEVRLYDPEALKKAAKTSEPGVLYKRFTCGPWVQNLFWMKNTNTLVLVQNQIEGRKWRFTFVDLEKSIETGKEVVLNVVETDRADELEGFAFLDGAKQGIAVTSSRTNNVNLMRAE
ncbi:MAG: hypothetical protein V5804_13525 [Mucilaginibacter sp.]|uniref:hypothetical protein n=1 Tax=Mucilaginibacter sp. TaxID=1882438 RepID=UPI0034E542AD